MTWSHLGWRAGHLRPFKTNLAPSELKRLCHTPLFPGERNILEAIQDVLREPSEEGDRIILLEESLLNVLCKRERRHFKVYRVHQLYADMPNTYRPFSGEVRRERHRWLPSGSFGDFRTESHFAVSIAP